MTSFSSTYSVGEEPEVSGATALVRQLHAEGVRHIFGVPGAQIMRLMDSLYDVPDIAFITNRHEQGSAYMADGYARVTGEPGVLTTVPGPGVYNACAGLATAYACSYPVLLLAGQINRERIGQRIGMLHEIHDQLEIVKPVTKWAHRSLTGDDLGTAVRDAFGQMRSGRPAPVSLEFPPEALAEAGALEVLASADIDQPALDEAAVTAAAAALAKARTPLIIAGGGVVVGDAHLELTALAERAQAAVVVTREGKAAIDNRHALFVGSAWANSKRLADVFAGADVVVAVGTRLEGFAAKPGQQVIRIDIDPTRLSGAADVEILGNARDALAAVTEILPANAAAGSRSRDVAAMRDALEKRLREFPQSEIVDTLRLAIPDDAVIAGGTTTVGYMCHAYLPIHSPRGYLSTSYMGTLGFSLAMGLGAKVGAPDRPVVTLSGDGGFLFGATELATAVQYGLNTVNIVFNDNAYGNPNREQHEDWKGRSIGTELRNPDFAAFGRSFGAAGVVARTPDELAGAIKDALSHDGPSVIEYPHERLPYVMRELPPGAPRRIGA